MTVNIQCIPTMTWTYVTDNSYSQKVLYSAIYISNNLVQSPACGWTPTYSITAGSAFASYSNANNNIPIYTDDDSLVGS